MSRPFTIGEETTHVAGDPGCAHCLEGYPERCWCTGLIHAAAGDKDPEGDELPLTRCDRCGRSEDEMLEPGP